MKNPSSHVFVYLLVISLGIVVSPSTIPMPSQIETDLRELVNLLLPMEKMKSIAIEHLKTDSGFQSAVKYMQSKEWTDLIETIREKPEWIAFKSFLKQTGVDIEAFVKCIKEFLQKNKVEDTLLPNAERDLRSFVIEVEENVPTAKVLELINDRLIKNPGFQQLHEKLASNEFRKLVEDVRSLPEIQRVMFNLKEMGINIDSLFAGLYIFLGWENPKVNPFSSIQG